jgi:hypothetical protein
MTAFKNVVKHFRKGIGQRTFAFQYHLQSLEGALEDVDHFQNKFLGGLCLPLHPKLVNNFKCKRNISEEIT